MARKLKNQEVQEENNEPTIEDYLTQLFNEIDALKNEVALLKQHEHGTNGQVVVPL